MLGRHALIALGALGAAVCTALVATGCGRSFADDCETLKTCLDDVTSDGGIGIDGAPGPAADATGAGDAGEGSATGDGSSVPDGTTNDVDAACGAATYCGAAEGCVDTTTSMGNCGGCGKVCAVPTGGSAICANGTCDQTCPAGLEACKNQCLALDDVSNCGGCGNVCPGPASGSNGSGTAACADAGCELTCAANAHVCQGDCLLNTDPPSADPCIVSPTYGVFVSASGSDASGNGTPAAPYATIGKGATAAKAAGLLDIFACGAFTASVAITSAMDGRKIYGGFSCATTTWTWSAATKTSIAPAAQGPALTVSGVTAGVTFTGFAFTSVAATAAGASSIAAEVSGSTGAVVFNSCSFTAGAGGTGQAGGTPTAPLPTPSVGNVADSASNSGGPITAACACPLAGVSSYGAPGGAGGVAPTSGGSGVPSLTANAGTAATAVPVAACSNGLPGEGGATGQAGSSATANATIVSGQWTPSVGGSGLPGGTAQGGGGGGGAFPSNSALGNGGGGGGCGGCGGAGGTGGAGGGSSIGLLVLDSPVQLQSSTIHTGTGGGGGSGAAGQGGAGGASHGNSPNACQGGNGGNGGKGGAGAGGSGGDSVGIAYQGTAPTLDAATQAAISTGGAGAKGTGGNSPSNDGLAGVASATLAVP